jgi:hypothetical protein
VPPRNQVYIELPGKIADYIIIEHVTHSSFAFRPVLMLLLLGVGPKYITQQSLVGYIGRSFDHFNISVVRQLLAQSAVHAQNLIIYQRCDWKLLKNCDELLEKFAVLLVVTG